MHTIIGEENMLKLTYNKHLTALLVIDPYNDFISDVHYAAELGYEVAMVKDATASYSDEEMHATLDVNIPNYATAIVATTEIVNSIFSF